MAKSNHGRFSVLVPFFVGLLLTTAVVRAQTGPDLLIKPWPRDRVVETESSAIFYNETTTGNAPDDGSSRYARFTLNEYSSEGRARLFPRDENVRADPRFGYNVEYLKLDTNDPNLPKKLTNESIAFGMGIADYDGWLAGISAGIGYAGAGAFQDGNGYYGRADLAVGRDLDKNTTFGVVLDYDGNRSFSAGRAAARIRLSKNYRSDPVARRWISSFFRYLDAG